MVLRWHPSKILSCRANAWVVGDMETTTVLTWENIAWNWLHELQIITCKLILSWAQNVIQDWPNGIQKEWCETARSNKPLIISSAKNIYILGICGNIGQCYGEVHQMDMPSSSRGNLKPFQQHHGLAIDKLQGPMLRSSQTWKTHSDQQHICFVWTLGPPSAQV
jgi:hypothetical protein